MHFALRSKIVELNSIIYVIRKYATITKDLYRNEWNAFSKNIFDNVCL